MAKLYFRYGAMNSGKTTALLQVAHNYEERGMQILLFKPADDLKAGDEVACRLGASRQVNALIPPTGHIYDYVDQDNLPDAIIVDEAQFLKAFQVDELYNISKILDVPVLTYGLRNDFQMNTFEGAARLLALADSIEELKTICTCGKKATQNVRLWLGKPIFEGESIAIDNDETGKMTYQSYCGDCYLKIKGVRLPKRFEGKKKVRIMED